MTDQEAKWLADFEQEFGTAPMDAMYCYALRKGYLAAARLYAPDAERLEEEIAIRQFEELATALYSPEICIKRNGKNIKREFIEALAAIKKGNEE